MRRFGFGGGSERSVPEPPARARCEFAETLVAVPARFVRVDAERYLAVLLSTGNTAVFDELEAALWSELRRPATVSELQRRMIALEWGPDSVAEIAQYIEPLVEAGYVETLTRWLGRFSRWEERPAPRVSAYAVPTKDRPETLARALSAWKPLLLRDGMPDVLIADDSARRASATRAVGEAFARSYPGRVCLIDERARRIVRDVVSSVDQQCARFAVASGVDEAAFYGSNRNAILLTLAGRAFVSADDDVVPVFRAFSPPDETLFMNAERDASVFWPAVELRECEEFGVALDPAVWEPSSILGGAVRELVSRVDRCDFSTIDDALVRDTLAVDSRVAAVTLCYWGDSGMRSPQHLLAARSTIHSGSLNEERYERLATSRYGLCAHERMTIGRGPFFGGLVAYDARNVLPPFSPRGRGEDALWRSCLSAFHPRLAVAYPPFAVGHFPDNRGAYDRSEITRWQPRLNDVLTLLVRLFGNELGPSAGYETVGSRFVALATGPENEARATFAELVARAAVGRIQLIESEYDTFAGEPAGWGADCLAAIEYLRTLLESPGFWVPYDIPDGERGLREYVERFGTLLAAWPSIFAAARERSDEIIAAGVIAV